MLGEKYSLIQILEQKEIKSELFEKNEDFIKRNPPFLEIRKIISLKGKSEFIPDSSNLSRICFNCYTGLGNLEKQEILKSLEFIDEKIRVTKFYKKFLIESKKLSKEKEYRIFIQDLYYVLCLESGYLPFSFPEDLETSKEYLERSRSFNPERIRGKILKLDLPLLFRKIFQEFFPRSLYSKDIEKIGNSSLSEFLEIIDFKFKGYKKQIIY